MRKPTSTAEINNDMGARHIRTVAYGRKGCTGIGQKGKERFRWIVLLPPHSGTVVEASVINELGHVASCLHEHDTYAELFKGVTGSKRCKHTKLNLPYCNVTTQKEYVAVLLRNPYARLVTGFYWAATGQARGNFSTELFYLPWEEQIDLFRAYVQENVGRNTRWYISPTAHHLEMTAAGDTYLTPDYIIDHSSMFASRIMSLLDNIGISYKKSTIEKYLNTDGHHISSKSLQPKIPLQNFYNEGTLKLVQDNFRMDFEMFYHNDSNISHFVR